MGEHFITENKTVKFKKTHTNNAKKSLNNYITQLKMHYDFDEKEIIEILSLVLKEKKNNFFVKKWWQILK